MDNLDRFKKIRDDLHTLSSRQAVEYLLALGPAEIKQWHSVSTGPNRLGSVFQVVFTEDINTYCVHSSSGPAGANGRPVYVLFGRVLDRQEWFRVLAYTDEEQTLHCLRWSR
jgi:hypothetical protein